MAGNAKFELSSVSPDDSGFSGNYSNGPRSNYGGPNLDRSGSFREGSDGRSFSSGSGSSKAAALSMAELPPLSQYLVLEPITMGDPKNIKTADLRRALSSSLGNVSEDTSFGAVHSKNSLTTDELKRFRAGVHDGLLKARSRVKRLDDSLNKMNKYLDALNSRKQLPNERSGASNLLKMGTQSRRSSPDLATQKLEDRTKNVALNKRARTPMGDMRAEGRSNGVPRQHLVLGKDKDGAKEGSSDLGEEKLRRLPAVGEGWDKKMKRKRSMINGYARSVDGDGELKRTMHGRLGNDSGIHSSDTHGFRSGSSNGATGSNKLEGGPSPVSLSGRMTPKNEPDKASLSKELTGTNKERLLPKGNSKLNMREDPSVFSPSSVTKGKASRALRNGSASVGNSSPSFSRMSGAVEDWEQSVNVNKVHPLAGVNNRKRPLPTESSSPPMAQWGGQRPQKISRNRRTNIVSPTSNPDEVQMSSEGCTPDFSTRISGAVNGFPVRNIMSSSQQLKAKLDNAPSPARLSESEENSAADNRLKDKEVGGSEMDDKSLNSHQHIGPGVFPKKNKLLVKGEIGDGVRRQGRSGRGSLLPKGGISPFREKLENSSMAKPVRNARPGSEKNGSKSGRPPLKKHSDRKGFTRLGPLPNSSSPDFTGESDDDREELLAAAQFACNASYNGCSSSFWKRLEPLFYIRPEDKFFLENQLNTMDDQSNLSEMPGDNRLSYDSQSELSRAQSYLSGESKMCMLDNGLTELDKTGDFINHFHELDSSCRESDSKKGSNSLTPLYQRVLSALIVEDEFEENHFLSNATSANRDDPCMVDRISCNGNASHSRFSNIQVPMDEEIEEGNYGIKHPAGCIAPGNYQNDTNGSLAFNMNASGNSSLDFQYDKMCVDEKLLLELQCIGLYPETVPDLTEGEDELINEDIIQLKRQLPEQAGKKKAYLDKLRKAVEDKEAEGRDLEQLALNRLIELAYRKLLSCFSEPALRDVLLAVPSYNIGIKAEQNVQLDSKASGAHIGGPEQFDLQNDKSDRSSFDAYESLSHQSDYAFAKNGPILNRGKKKEVLLDDVGVNPALRSTATLGSSLLGGAKGKRSERDSGGKAGRPSISNVKGERKTKSKPKQKAAQLSIHPVQPSGNTPGDWVPILGNEMDLCLLGTFWIHLKRAKMFWTSVACL
ncbi:Guanine nucleotide-binding protein-like alpha-11 subunit [Bienertia sinuspersici]